MLELAVTREGQARAAVPAFRYGYLPRTTVFIELMLS